MKPRFILLPLLLAVYGLLLFPLNRHMSQRSLPEKMGPTPAAEALQFLTADQRQFTAAALALKVFSYFGAVIEPDRHTLALASTVPDFVGMYRVLQTVVRLDPYNMDAYYFAQSVLVWDMGRYEEAIALMEYGMRHRTWDHYLPFFAGFNAAYFLKDYQRAAVYYRRAAELTGSDWMMRLVGRYLYEANQTDLAIAYLKTMISDSNQLAVRQSLVRRLAALEEIRKIEEAVARFKSERQRLPWDLAELVVGGYLAVLPVDPYGGAFFLDEDGRIRTTSRMAGP